MADYTVKRIDEMETAFRGSFKRARAELGVTAFGMQVIDLPPNLETFPEHDHAERGQEEVYAVVRGTGEIDVDGERVALSPDVMIRVGPAARRKIYSGPDGMRIIALGGKPGAVYEAPDVTELGGPDPMARDRERA